MCFHQDPHSKIKQNYVNFTKVSLKGKTKIKDKNEIMGMICMFGVNIFIHSSVDMVFAGCMCKCVKRRE